MSINNKIYYARGKNPNGLKNLWGVNKSVPKGKNSPHWKYQQIRSIYL